MKKTGLILAAGLGLLSSAAAFLSGCTTTSQLNPEAENIIVMFPPVPSGCKQLGYISASDVNGVNQAYTSHSELVKDEVYSLANRTAEMGGNVLVILTHKTQYLGKKSHSIVDKDSVNGIACYCASSRVPKLLGHPVSGLKFDQMVFE